MPYVFNPFTGKLDQTDIPAFNGEVTAGTQAAPSIFFTGDPNTGIYSPGADQLALATNGNGRLFVDANGNVGIGTASPGGSSTDRQFTLTGSNSSQLTFNSGAVSANFGTTSSIGYIQIPGAYPLVLYTNNLERLRITSTGQVRLAGAGITFNGDTAAANELDDYEEGTFTPEFRDGATGNAAAGYSQRTGKYTKIGNLVTYYIFLNDVNTTGLTAGNLVYITGLPFASVNLQFRDVPATATCGSATPTTGAINFAVIYNQSYGILINGTTTGSTNFTVSQATSGAFDCYISGQYYVS